VVILNTGENNDSSRVFVMGNQTFLRRGSSNVFTEAILYSFACNVNKSHRKKKRQLLGTTPHFDIYHKKGAALLFLAR